MCIKQPINDYQIILMSSAQKRMKQSAVGRSAFRAAFHTACCLFRTPPCLLRSKDQLKYCPLHFIPRKSLSGTVRSLRLHVQRSEPSPPTSPGGHTIPPYILRLSTPSKQEEITLPAPLFTATAFIFDCPHVYESVHLDRKYFNRSKDMQKMYLSHKPTCSHEEGMFLQLTFQPDFLGQFLEQLTPPPTHTHVYAHFYPNLTPQCTDCIFSHPGFGYMCP